MQQGIKLSVEGKYNMAGGRADVASTPESRKIDNQVRKASKEVYEQLKDKYPGLIRYHKLPKQYFLHGFGACAPDGGVWFYNGNLIAAFEAKRGGNNQGNAIERWFKNHRKIEKMNGRCPLVTYAVGAGVRKTHPIYRALYEEHGGNYNVFRGDGSSCFLSESGFTLDELKESMRSFIVGELGRGQTL